MRVGRYRHVKAQRRTAAASPRHRVVRPQPTRSPGLSTARVTPAVAPSTRRRRASGGRQLRHDLLDRDLRRQPVVPAGDDQAKRHRQGDVPSHAGWDDSGKVSSGQTRTSQRTRGRAGPDEDSPLLGPLELEAQVRRRRRMGERADRDVLHARRRHGGELLERDAARRLERNPAADEPRPPRPGRRATCCRAGSDRVRLRPRAPPRRACGTRPRAAGRREARARARTAASKSPPPSVRWLSFTRMASSSAMRWFVPPPVRTAYFASTRMPGTVLRVSRTTSPVPATRSTYAPGERRDAAQVLQEVQRQALAGEQRARRSLDRRHHVARPRQRRPRRRAAGTRRGPSLPNTRSSSGSPHTTSSCLARSRPARPRRRPARSPPTSDRRPRGPPPAPGRGARRRCGCVERRVRGSALLRRRERDVRRPRTRRRRASRAAPAAWPLDARRRQHVAQRPARGARASRRSPRGSRSRRRGRPTRRPRTSPC